MMKKRTTRYLVLSLAKPAWLSALGIIALPAVSQEVAEIQNEAVLEDVGLILDELPFVDPGEEDLGFDPANYKPGFSLKTADEDLQKQIADLNNYVGEADWARAFRLLTEISDQQLEIMVPLGGEGQYVLVKEALQRQLLSLKPEGRRAYRLYFDAQASELFNKIKNHAMPGSDEQMVQAQTLVDRLLASSVGAEAAVLLGDMQFERGLFDQAARSWQLALDQGSASGQEALTLQAMQALALQRAGKDTEARLLLEGLAGRYGQAMIQAGGEAVDAIAMLSASLGQPDPALEQQDDEQASRKLLPKPEAMPAWHLRFLDRTAQNTVAQARGRSHWYTPPLDLMKYVPPVVADDERVYFHWLGVVFAIDQETGKTLWQNGTIKETAATLVNRIQTAQGDPRNYRIALDKDTLLVSQTQTMQNDSPLVMKAYDTETGLVRWTSDSRQDWSLNEPDKPQQGVTVVLGEPLVTSNGAYTVVHRAGQRTLYLRQFDPASGEVAWTLPLGDAESINFQYTQVNRMPQPKLMMGQSHLYVMTNNGAILAVDVIASEVKWALRMDPPFGIGHQQDRRNFNRNNQLGVLLQSMANVNGSGAILLHDNTLYAKEHNGKSLYAIDPTTGDVKWSADQLKPDAKLVGITSDRFYLMDEALQSYRLDGDRELITKNGVQTGSPDHAGPIMLDDRFLIYANGKLRELDSTNLDPAGKYENLDYLGQNGGHLYAIGDLLIAIDTNQITAFKITEN